MRIIGMPKNFIGARPGRVYSWGGSASIQTASGTAVTFPQAAERPLSGLNVYGHSTQSGTPSPENPVPIVSAGSVMTTGAQLLNINSGEISGSNIENITNTLTSGETYTYTNIDSPVPTIMGGRNASGDYIPFDNGVYASAGNGFTFVMPDNVAYLILGGSGGTIDKGMRFMLNSGSTALPWEPYTGGVPGANPYEGEINVSVSDGGTQSQALTLSTPGGLPGIPVSSGGNYTDESGQQWVCDEIDLKRGKYVKRVKSVTFDGSENWEISSSDKGNQYFKCNSTKPDYTEDDPNMAGLSSMVKVVRYDRIDIYGDNDVISWIFYWRLRLSNLDISAGATVDDLKQFLASNPITVYYTSLTPIENDLPAEEIAAYKAMHTYSPTTTVTNDAEAWMKVGYVTEE